MASAARKKKEEGLGEYKGYPISAIKVEVRGLEGGFSKAQDALGAHETDPNDPAWFGVKAIPSGIRHDIIRDDDGAIVSFELVQIYKTIGVAYTTEAAIGEGVHAVMEEVARLEALNKRGQTSFTMPDPEDLPANKAAAEEHGDLADRVNDAFPDGKVTPIRPGEIRAGVPDDEGKGEPTE